MLCSWANAKQIPQRPVSYTPNGLLTNIRGPVILEQVCIGPLHAVQNQLLTVHSYLSASFIYHALNITVC